MPYGTVAAILSRGNKAPDAPERFTPDASADIDERAPAWDGSQGETADRYGRIVRGLLTHVEALLAQGRYKDVRDAMVSAAVATDKAQLLSGHATTRSESRTAVLVATADKVRAMVDRLPPKAQGLVIPSRVVSDLPQRAAGTDMVADGAPDGASD